MLYFTLVRLGSFQEGRGPSIASTGPNQPFSGRPNFKSDIILRVRDKILGLFHLA